MQEHPIILFDGVCNVCNSSITFIIKQDRNKVFRLAALQSDAGQKLLKEYRLPKQVFESFLLLEDGNVYQRSSAGLKVCSKLPWYWKWTQLFWAVPTFLRDAVYNFVAKNRYKWFGKKEQCMIPT